MIITKEDRRYHTLRELKGSGQRPTPSPSRFRVLWLVLALLAGLLVFSHGCHGDEDTELVSRDWWTSW